VAAALNAPLRKQYTQSCGAPKKYPRRTGEAWYIPRRHFGTVAKDIVPVLSPLQLPVDIGVPMLFFALEHPQQYDHILDNMIVDTVTRNFKASFTPWNASVAAVPALAAPALLLPDAPPHFL